MKTNFIQPNWPVPQHIKACTTVRYPLGLGNYSRSCYEGLNLGDHVADQPEQVADNRAWLAQDLALKHDPIWLTQTHSTRVVNAAYAQQQEEADAVVAFHQGVCCVMTADCLPVLVADQRGRVIAAAHAGWRGLADGILENSVAAMNESPQRLHAWLGPAIGPEAFEVGEDVVNAFVSMQPQAEECFVFDQAGSTERQSKWKADIYALARLRLKAMGVRYIYGGEYCTYTQNDQFYSYRRDGVTGRMASLIWFDQE